MKFTIKTIGCKVNTYESMKIKEELIKLGFEYIDVEEKSSYKDLDFYIVNTCSVTKIADKKSRQMLHLAKKYNPDVKVIAIGCMVDSLTVGANANTVGANANTVGADTIRPIVGASFTSPISGVDYLINNKDKSKLAEFLLSLTNENNNAKAVTGESLHPSLVVADTINTTVSASYASPKSIEAICASKLRIRSFIKIQDGCNQYCTYCIIPFLRGNIKSRDNDDIIAEVKQKVKDGVKEIVLTGIHLSSFGLDRVGKSYESEGAIDIARNELLNIMLLIADIDGVERIRLGSLEPRIINENFLSSLAGANANTVGANANTVGANANTVGANANTVGANACRALYKKFCANFCLSLQSGCDRTLKRMNRHYTTSDYEKACNIIRKHMPYATITTDVIVGFPGETEEDFKESLAFVKKMRFYNPNIFPYSRRQGTKADLMPEQLTNEVKHERAKTMIEACEKITKEIEKEYFDKYSDKAIDVLIEESIEKDGRKIGIGYTKEYVRREVDL